MPVKKEREKKEVFLWIFHGESTREKSTCQGKHPIFMLSAAKSRWLNFKYFHSVNSNRGVAGDGPVFIFKA